MTQKWLQGWEGRGGREPWFAQKCPSGPPGVGPHTHLPPRRAQQGLQATFPRCSCWRGARPQSALSLSASSEPSTSGVRPEGNQSVSITCRGRKSMALYFLKSSRLRATAGDRPAVSSHAGSLRELLVKTERCLPHTPLGTEAQVLDHDHW